MGFADRFKKAMGIPDPPSAAEVRWQAFRVALNAGDAAKCLELAFGYMRAQDHETALRAFEQMEQRLPERRGEWLRWQGQTLYIGLGLRTDDPAQKRELWKRALLCYYLAADAGDRTQEFNAVELCEHLAAEPMEPDQKRAMLERYLASYPEGSGRKKVEALLGALPK